jgi:hypothetical protein
MPLCQFALTLHHMAKASAVPIHRVVRMNYKNRTGPWLIAFAVLATYFGEHAYGLWVWLFMGLQFLVYPHLVFLRARHALDPATSVAVTVVKNFCWFCPTSGWTLPLKGQSIAAAM